LKSDPDDEDIRRVLDGDTSAFEGVVRRWQGPLVSLAYRYCRNRATAEEMAQEAFLSAFQSLGGWRREAAFSTWLFAIAINRYRSHMRRFRPQELPLDAHRHRLQSTDPHNASDVAETVRQSVCRLPARYRDCLTLFYFHDKDLSETAKSLGIPEGTVKARLHRGRQLLKRRLSILMSSAKMEGGS
jgi:RNA polymerase sigma-70 factor (ECF subfamily)